MLVIVWYILAGIVAILLLSGIRIIRPTERAVKETLGRYSGPASLGFNFVIPMIQRLAYVNITEQMAEIDSQEMITEDKLNVSVDLVVFYKVKADEENVKKALYNVNNFQNQIIILAQTTARNVIGSMEFNRVNSERNELNEKLAKVMKVETANWGVEIVRVELKEIIPPKDVQDTMNKVLKAQNEKRAATDFATATETQADGAKRATIKEAEGIAKGRMIVADATAYKTKVENDAARKYFTGNAQKLKQLEVAQNSLQSNTKIVLGADSKGILKLFDINK